MGPLVLCTSKTNSSCRRGTLPPYIPYDTLLILFMERAVRPYKTSMAEEAGLGDGVKCMTGLVFVFLLWSFSGIRFGNQMNLSWAPRKNVQACSHPRGDRSWDWARRASRISPLSHPRNCLITDCRLVCGGGSKAEGSRSITAFQRQSKVAMIWTPVILSSIRKELQFTRLTCVSGISTVAAFGGGWKTAEE